MKPSFSGFYRISYLLHQSTDIFARLNLNNINMISDGKLRRVWDDIFNVDSIHGTKLFHFFDYCSSFIVPYFFPDFWSSGLFEPVQLIIPD